MRALLEIHWHVVTEKEWGVDQGSGYIEFSPTAGWVRQKFLRYLDDCLRNHYDHALLTFNFFILIH